MNAIEAPFTCLQGLTVPMRKGLTFVAAIMSLGTLESGVCSALCQRQKGKCQEINVTPGTWCIMTSVPSPLGSGDSEVNGSPQNMPL